MRPAIFTAVALTLLVTHRAKSMPIPTETETKVVPVPVSRLTENVSRYIKNHPKDFQGYYTLARIHSIAYAENVTQAPLPISIVRGNQVQEEQVVGAPEKVVETIVEGGDYKDDGKDLPEVNGYGIMPRDNPARPISAEDLYHLKESVRNYLKATALAPQDSLCWLGLGWMYEQGAPYAPQLGAIWEKTPSKTKSSQPSEWRTRALGAYRHSYKIDLANDDPWGAVEAGESILRMFSMPAHKLTAQEQAEAKRVRLVVEKIRKRPIPISPIILPLERSASLPDLLSPRRSVTFDLTGDNLGRRWPWVKPDTGILVWDPQHKGQITSGRQLFGSVTWWIFWKNGYQALAALDNDGNGELTGHELDGISIWQDANSNGISDSGEIKPLKDWGSWLFQRESPGTSELLPPTHKAPP